MQDLGIDAWITIGTVLGMFAALLLTKLLIPLSYAAGMGGVCTLIGTPPNLVVNGLYADRTGTAMNVLATTLPGLFCLSVGVLSVIAMHRLLPSRKVPESAFEDIAEYTVELLVPSDNE